MDAKRSGEIPGVYGRLGDLGAIDARCAAGARACVCAHSVFVRRGRAMSWPVFRQSHPTRHPAIQPTHPPTNQPTNRKVRRGRLHRVPRAGLHRRGDDLGRAGVFRGRGLGDTLNLAWVGGRGYATV
jgi:hypothetical protein